MSSVFEEQQKKVIRYAEFDSSHRRLHCVDIKKKNLQSINLPSKQAKSFVSYHNCRKISGYLTVNLEIQLQLQEKW